MLLAVIGLVVVTAAATPPPPPGPPAVLSSSSLWLPAAAAMPCGGAGCCTPCGAGPFGTFLEIPAFLDVGGAGALGGVAGELVLLTLASPIALVLGNAGDPVTLDAFVWVMAVAWPLGAGGYAADRAEERGGDPFAVGIATGVASAAVIGTGMVFLETNKNRSDVDGATVAFGVVGFLGAASVAAGVTAGVAQAVSE